MTFALNEIEAMAKGAARGAGFDWGIAEETGKSVRWLAARGLPGPELLIKTLKRSESITYSVAAPNITREPWMAPGGWLCPSFAGAAIVDCAQSIAAGHKIQLGNIYFPLLLVPYAAMCGKYNSCIIEVSWPGATFTIATGGGLFIVGDEWETAAVEWVRCCRIDKVPSGPPIRETSRCSVPGPIFDSLNEYTQRTYAPATSESRERGAG